MATVSENEITIYQGETLDIQFNVVDEDGAPYNLTGGAAVLSYQKGTATAVNVTGTINTTTVTVSFAHATTQLMSDRYAFQLMCRNSGGKIVMVRNGFINVWTSINPDAVSVP